MKMHELFDPEDQNLQPVDSLQWRAQIFERAYCGGDAPFEKVCTRLRQGASVLVYLSGNCMEPAAKYVNDSVHNNSWRECGQRPEGADGILSAWKNTSTSIVNDLVNWLKGGGKRTNVIFHNLDLLTDGRGNVYGHPDAQSVLFSLLLAARNGAVLGLSDRDAGQLPAAIERAFSEKIWIEEIPTDSFPRLIPVTLGEKILVNGEPSPAAAWLIGSRLRYNDPIRAVKIMQAAAANQADLQGITQEIWRLTRAVEFLDPGKEFPLGPSNIEGFEHETIQLLQQSVIKPFISWTQVSGSLAKCQALLQRLQPGLILHGPPGTGKTRLAQWLAGSLQLPVRVINGAEIKAGLFGDPEKNVHRIFSEARRAAPCVLILDDGDDIVPDRSAASGSTASAERGIVDAILQELQGVCGDLSGVLVIMTTNRFDSIDSAVRERLDLHVRVPYPVNKEQVEAIMHTTAHELAINLEATVQAILLKRLMALKSYAPKAGGPTDPSKPDQRRRAEENLFSPREIRQAMRILAGTAKPDGAGICTPNEADVQRMIDYYDKFE